jgi:hypothetical protein
LVSVVLVFPKLKKKKSILEIALFWSNWNNSELFNERAVTIYGNELQLCFVLCLVHYSACIRSEVLSNWLLSLKLVTLGLWFL